MTYDRFEDLPVWKAAADFAAEVFDLMGQPEFGGCGDLADQVERAGLSISNNIAEGFERGTTEDLLWFIYIARGSAGECRSALRVASRIGRLGKHRARVEALIVDLLSISRQLRGWANSLQNSEIRGQRHLSDLSRSAWEQEQRAKAFTARLEEIRRQEIRRRGAKRQDEKDGGKD